MKSHWLPSICRRRRPFVFQSFYSTLRKPIAELASKLKVYSDAYYNTGKPLVSDAEFDLLKERFLSLATKEEADQLEVGSLPPSGTNKIIHTSPMLSLESSRTLEGLSRFHDSVCRYLAMEQNSTSSTWKWATEMKYDGMAVALHYDENGKLQKALSRGDGRTGEVLPLALVTKHAASSIPLQLNGNAVGVMGEVCEVRGELLLSRDQFAQLALQREGYKSARNSVVGILRNEASVPPEELQLHFVSYALLSKKTMHADYGLRVRLLRELGFQPCPHYRLHDDWESVMMEVQRWIPKHFRVERVPFDVDGIVIKLDDARACESMGNTRHHPRHMIAFKWSDASLSASTVISQIEWSADQSAALRPVAIVDPSVEFDGAVVSRASLHNWSFIKRHRLSPGTAVTLERAGGVIPRIVPHEVDPSKPEPTPPSQCPCPRGASVCESGDGQNLMCSLGDVCMDRLAYRAYAVATALRIRGLGLSTCQQLAREDMLSASDPWAALRVTLDQLVRLEGWKEKRAQSLLDNIASAVASASFVQSLMTLGISGVGEAAWTTIVQSYPSLSALSAANVKDLESLPGVGQLTAQSVCAKVNPSSVRQLEQGLSSVGLKTSHNDDHPSSDALPLRGMQICITGRTSVPRGQLASAIRKAGGSAAASVTSKTFMVVAGDKPTAEKIEKANRLQVPVVSEEQLRQKLGLV